MPALQYPNPNKPFKLFKDASKHHYSGILHQDKEGEAGAREPESIRIAYFSGTFNKSQHPSLEHYTKGMLCSLQISSKIHFLSYRYRQHIILQSQNP